MDKRTLYKLFYIDKDKYKDEYDLRFNGDDTIRLNFKIEGHKAFICQSTQIYKYIVSIQRTDKQVNEVYGKLPGVASKQFAKRCLIDEIVLSNNIEGVSSTRKEIDKILTELSTKNKRVRFVGLVNKYRKLMGNEKISIETCNDIRKIYDDLFYKEIQEFDHDSVPDGEIFRKDGVCVQSATGKIIHRGLEPESKIISAMENALDFLSDNTVDFFIRISVFHYLFGYIHPFYDGNGRTDRFISSYLLSQELNNLIGFRISNTIKENIKKYYEAFKICNHPNNKGDLTPFVEVFLEFVDISEKKLLEALTERFERFKFYSSLISKLPLGEKKDMGDLYFLLIQAALFSEKGISTTELEIELNKSRNTVSAKMKKIPEELKIVNLQGRQQFHMINLDEIDKIIM